MIRLFVGLGNPGKKYDRNRHNLGYRVIDLFCGQKDVRLRAGKKSETGSFQFNGKNIWLMKPLTYMNLSGEAIASFARKKGIKPEEILVIHDEIALPLGQLRLKPKGGPGGHNGLTSVIVSLGTEEFRRLRLGVDAPPPGIDLSAYVLSNFLSEQERTVIEMVDTAAKLCQQILDDGFSKTMTYCNQRKLS